jgi:type IV fimbrial biogenesis protein FimT
MAHANIQRGFTLIELMVTIGTLTILIVAAVPSILTTVRNTQIRSIASSWRDGLAQARIEAIRRNALVRFSPNGASWQLQLQDPANPGNWIAMNPDVRYDSSSVIAARVQIALVANATAVYNGTGRMVPLNGNFVARFTPASGTCVATGGDARCLSVEATGGYVRSCDPAAAAGSTTACTAGG